MQEIAVVQRLQAEVVELQVAAGVERRAQARQVELHQLLVQQFGLHALLDELREIFGVALGHLRLRDFIAQDFVADRVQQQPRGGAGVGGLLFHQRARRQDGGLEDLVHRHAVVQVAAGLGQDRLGLDVVAEAGAGRLDQRAQRRHVQRHALAAVDDVQLGRPGRRRRGLARALLRAPLPVQHVGARDLVVAAAHEAEFDVVLDVLDVEGAAAGARAQQRAHDGRGELVDRLAHAGRGRALGAVHGEEGLHQRHRDLVRLEADHGAVAADDLVADVSVGAGQRVGRGQARGGGPALRGALRCGGQDRLASNPLSDVVCWMGGATAAAAQVPGARHPRCRTACRRDSCRSPAGALRVAVVGAANRRQERAGKRPAVMPLV